VKPEVVVPALVLALLSWQLYRAFFRGRVPGTQTLDANREETPILFWLLTAGQGVIWLFVLDTLLRGLFPSLPPIWPWP